MDSFVFDVLTEHALYGLRRDVIEREKYEIFFEAVANQVCRTVSRCLRGTYPRHVCRLSRMGMISRASKLSAIVPHFGELRPLVAGPRYTRIWTWVDYANTLRNALAMNNLVDLCDKVTFFKIVMFVKYMRSQFNAPITVVQQRTLAIHLVEFILNDAAGPGEEEVAADGPGEEEVAADGPGEEEVAADGPGEEEVAADGPGEEEVAADGPGEEEVAADGPGEEEVAADGPGEEEVAADGPGEEEVAADGPGEEEVAADGPGEEEVAADGPGEEEVAADGPGEEEVAADGPGEEEVAADGPGEEEVAADEDAAVVMETKVSASGSRRSKRLSRGLLYEEELSREREAKRRYGLRITPAREERLALLKRRRRCETKEQQ